MPHIALHGAFANQRHHTVENHKRPAAQMSQYDQHEYGRGSQAQAKSCHRPEILSQRDSKGKTQDHGDAERIYQIRVEYRNRSPGPVIGIEPPAETEFKQHENIHGQKNRHNVTQRQAGQVQ